MSFQQDMVSMDLKIETIQHRINLMKLETDLHKIKTLSERNHHENWDFRAFLKGYDLTIEEMDAIVHQIYEQIASEIDCTDCANCCRQISPVLDQEDVDRFCDGLGMSVRKFKKRYLQTKDAGEGFILKEKPCPFLENNLCSNYSYRPKACKSYPHLHKKEFVFRLWGVVENCSVCPIVFNVYEQLKDELWSKKPGVGPG